MFWNLIKAFRTRLMYCGNMRHHYVFENGKNGNLMDWNKETSNFIRLHISCLNFVLLLSSAGWMPQFHQGLSPAKRWHLVCVWDQCIQPFLSNLQGTTIFSLAFLHTTGYASDLVCRQLNKRWHTITGKSRSYEQWWIIPAWVICRCGPTVLIKSSVHQLCMDGLL